MSLLIHDTEDKKFWTENSKSVEKDFVQNVCVPLGLDVIIHPDKALSPYGPDLLVNGRVDGDLKKQTTPFFMSQRYDVDPQYAFSFNKKDADRYSQKYPSIELYVWICYVGRSCQWNDRKVQPINALYETPFSSLYEDIQSGKYKLHSYQRRIADTRGNAKESYIIDVRNLHLLHSWEFPS